MPVRTEEMLKVVENTDAIEVQSRMRTRERVFFALLSLFPLIAPYELIVRTDWHGYLNVFFLFCALISAGALVLSVFFVWAAVAGLSTCVRFDRRRGTVTYSSGAPVVPWRTTERPLTNLAELRVGTRDWSDGGPSYFLVAQMSDGTTFETGSSWIREEIEGMLQQVSEFLGRSTEA